MRNLSERAFKSKKCHTDLDVPSPTVFAISSQEVDFGPEGNDASFVPRNIRGIFGDRIDVLSSILTTRRSITGH